MRRESYGYDVGDFFGTGTSQDLHSTNRHKQRAIDAPLRCGISLATDAVNDPSLNFSVSEKVQEACLCIIGNLLSLPPDQNFVFYSSDNNHYAGIGRYAPKWPRRKYIIEALDVLARAELIEDCRTKPSPQAWYRSRVRASERLKGLTADFPASVISFRPPELVVLRGEGGQPLHYEDCDVLRAVRREISNHNEFIASAEITISHSSKDERGYLLVGKTRINPNKTAFYRIFNKRMSWGGRYYGPWWQGIPSSFRAEILINGEKSIEEDFRCCHVGLLFAAGGQVLGDRDPYAEVGLPRRDVKLAIQMMLNARSPLAATRALTMGLKERHGVNAATRCRELVSRLHGAFPSLSPYWSAGCGIRLQNLDSRICTRVHRRLRQAGIPCLSLHDSFIVQNKSAEFLRGVTSEELANAHMRVRDAGLEPAPRLTLDDF